MKTKTIWDELDEAFGDDFMVPNIVEDTMYLCVFGWTPEPEVNGGATEEATGFWARLSAPGYLDCTDWSGPFDTEEEAARYLLETYGGDL